jgi:hypothetical protein
VRVEGSLLTVGHQIRVNSIRANVGLGIDLVLSGNGGQQAPVIQGYLGGELWGIVSGCPGCTVDVYQDTGGEGESYVGTTTTNGTGAWRLAGAAHTFGDFTAVATAPYNFFFSTVYNSSEFSAPFAAPFNYDGDAINDATDPCPFHAEDYDAFDDGDGCPEADNDGDGICDPGQTAVGCTGSDFGRYAWQNPLAPEIDCRGVAEDFDAFHDDDGCPEADNDYDTFPDVADDCPGSDANAGADGISDTGDEPILYLTPYQAREDFDGVIDTDGCHDSPDDDYDGDGLGDETEAFSVLTDPVNADTDGDAVADGPDNCRLWPNPSQALPPNYTSVVGTGPDSDCDRFSNARETYLTTSPTSHCAATPTPNNEGHPDFWPLEMNDNRQINTVDVGSFVGKLGLDNGDAGWTSRLDLIQNMSGLINTVDVGLYAGRLGSVCSPTGP